jgi:hypothetical protein
LWQFVKRIFAEKPAYLGQSPVSTGFGTRAERIDIGSHRAKLIEYEWLAVLAGALLFEDGGAIAGKSYNKCYNDQKRAQNDQRQDRNQGIEAAFYNVERTHRNHVIRKQRRRQRFTD